MGLFIGFRSNDVQNRLWKGNDDVDTRVRRMVPQGCTLPSWRLRVHHCLNYSTGSNSVLPKRTLRQPVRFTRLNLPLHMKQNDKHRETQELPTGLG